MLSLALPVVLAELQDVQAMRGEQQEHERGIRHHQGGEDSEKAPHSRKDVTGGSLRR